MAIRHQDPLINSIAKLHLNSDYSDLKIICEQEEDERTEFPVHRAIVCSQSTVLAREVSGNFKEGRTGTILHAEFDAITVGRMVQYLYTQDYDAPMSSSPKPIEEETQKSSTVQASEEFQRGVMNDLHDSTVESDSSTSLATEAVDAVGVPQMTDELPEDLGGVNDALLAHIKVHAIANYYDIPALKTKAAEKFTGTLTRWPWKKDGFAKVLTEVYKLPESQDAGLRREVVSAAQNHMRCLSSDKNFIKAINESDCLGDFCATIMSETETRDQFFHRLESVVKRELHEKIDKLDKTLEETLESRDQEEAGRMAAEKAFKTVHTILSTLQECRSESCGAQINVKLDRSGRHGNGDWLVKCGKCGAKHTDKDVPAPAY